MGQDTTEPPPPPVHLVVLQHGLWGNTTCVSNLETFLRQQLGPHAAAAAADQQASSEHNSTPVDAAAQQQREEVQILNSDVNRKALTYDGIDVCGARVVKMVLDCIQLLQGQGRQVSKLSFIGYSLGGLILRYAVGKLYVLGLFEEVCCANFITIATPHLGSWRCPTSFWARFFNAHVSVVGSRTGRQLMLADTDYSVPWLTQQQQLHEQHTHTHDPQQQEPQQQGQGQQQQQQPQVVAELPPGVSPGRPVPLLLLMAHPCGPFHRALAGFRTRLVAANILYDAMTPYCTAALCMTNPYEERLAVSIDADRYPSVVRPAADGEVVTELTHKGRTKRLFLFALFSPLAPLLYAWTVTYGYLHHLSARKKTLEGSWLQQHPAAPTTAPAPAPAAAVPGLQSSLSLRSSSSSRRSSKQAPLLPGAGGRTAATLAGGADPSDPAVLSDDGLITTAVEELGDAEQPGQQGGRAGAGSERSSLERAMQQVAAATAGDADGGASQLQPSSPAAAEGAAVGGEGAAAGGFSRRRSDSLAAAVAAHQQEDELGRLSRQFVHSSSGKGSKDGKGSKASIRAGLQGPPGGTAQFDQAAAGGTAGVVAAGAVGPGTAEAAAGATAAGTVPAGGGEEGQVTVDRDGIVAAPHLLHVQQEWMARQLFDNMPPCHLPERGLSGSTRQHASPSSSSSSPSGEAASKGAGTAAGAAASTTTTTTSSSSSSSSSAAPGPAKKDGWTQEQQCQAPQQGGVASGSSSSSSSSSSSGSRSAGGWHRVDVCTRHWHAHAAIIIRDYRFAGQSRDMFQYLVDHMTL